MKPAEWWLPEAQQRAFRAVLDGFARPGTLVHTAPHGAVLTFLSTVLDESVTLADPQRLLGDDERRLLWAPDAPAAQARFVLLDGRRAPAPDFQPALGTLESPELGATLVLAVDALAEAPSASHALRLQLQGPGLPGERTLAVDGLHPEWLARRGAWVAAFPMGVDVVLAAADVLAALPRTTRIAVHAAGKKV